MPENKKICFVIMPFGKTTKKHTEGYWTKQFDAFLKPLIEETPELEAYRSKPLRGDILREIITSVVTAPIVVADLTDNNPNVYWELGVRQSFKHGTITIAEGDTKLPFDVGGKGSLFYYPKDHLKMQEFRKQFKSAIKDCLKNPDRPDSHVLETLSGRGTLFEIFRRDEAIRRLDAVISECKFNEDGLNDFFETAKKNQKKPEDRAFPTTRLRLTSTELLITNRYIEADDSFYHLASKYWSKITAINDQLNQWESSSSTTEKWLIGQEEKSKKLEDKFTTKVTENREKLTKKL